MTNIRDIERTIECAAEGYQVCADTLCLMRCPGPEGFDRERFLGFQSTLLESMLHVERRRVALAGEKGRLVARKQALSPAWFGMRIRKLALYQDWLQAALATGRVLGDAFAWFFYHDEHELLRQHLAHEPISAPPGGAGGLGELGFLQGVRSFDGHMVLYHGMTSFLRIGDISVIDPRAWRVVALGELKSRQVEPDTFEVTVNLVGPKETRLAQSAQERSRAVAKPMMLPQKSADRLKRQLRSMERAVQATAKSPETPRKGQMRALVHTTELMDLVRSTKSSRPQCARMGSALIVVAARTKTRSFFSKIVGGPVAAKGSLRTLPTLVAHTAVKGSKFNMLWIDDLQYSRSGAGFPPGMAPLFWLIADPQTAKQIMLREVVVTTVHNPAHLIAAVERLGFTAAHDQARRTLDLTKQVHGKVLKLEGFGYFCALVSKCLMSEADVARMIRKAVRDVPVDLAEKVTHFEISPTLRPFPSFRRRRDRHRRH